MVWLYFRLDDFCVAPKYIGRLRSKGFSRWSRIARQWGRVTHWYYAKMVVWFPDWTIPWVEIPLSLTILSAPLEQKSVLHRPMDEDTTQLHISSIRCSSIDGLLPLCKSFTLMKLQEQLAGTGQTEIVSALERQNPLDVLRTFWTNNFLLH